MTPAPHFVSLSMIVTGRAWGDQKSLTWMDCLAYAIERDGDPVDLPPLVARTVEQAVAWSAKDRAQRGRR